ncbi:MAG: DUF4340 domain-containing protein [Acetobacteraceae bacterium]|nr:DUF4340 domain-containing protein [Acetobacteraceae bacterium]
MSPARVLALSVAAAAAIGAAVLFAPDRTAPPPLDQHVAAFPGLAERLARAATIEVARHDGRTTLRRDGERWTIAERGGYPARPERVRELLVGLAELRLTEPRTANPDLLPRLGVEDPLQPGATGTLLRVLDGSGAPLAELVIGRRRVRTGGNLPETAYVRRPGEPQAWLAEGRIPADHDPNLWLPREIASLPRERFREAVIIRPGAEPFAVRRGPDPDGELSLDPLPEGAEADPDHLASVARAFEALTLTDVRPEAEASGQPAGEGRWTFTDGLVIHVRLRRDGQTLWLLPRAEGGEEASRLDARWRGFAFQIGSWQEETFSPEHATMFRAAPPRDAPGPDPAPPAPPRAE